jgi:hypothetical protein
MYYLNVCAARDVSSRTCTNVDLHVKNHRLLAERKRIQSYTVKTKPRYMYTGYKC